jgi:cyclin B
MRRSYHIKNSISNFSIDNLDENKLKINNNNNLNNNKQNLNNINKNDECNEQKIKIIEELNLKIEKAKISSTISPNNHLQSSVNMKSFEKGKENKTMEINNHDVKNNITVSKEEEKITEKEFNIPTEKNINNIKSSPNKNIEQSLIEKEKKHQIIEDKLYGKYFQKIINDNIQIPTEYIDTIYYNLLIEEKEGITPKPEYNYMKKQTEINEQMRSILVDWIIDIHCKFGFTDETLFMTILSIDRYLSVRKISRSKLQLLGVAALMISCKHEEIDLPKADDFIYITDNAYTRNEIFKMENDILHLFKFCLLYPSPIKFYEMLSINFKFSKKQFFMGKYLMESFLIDIKNIKYKSSIISCACTYIVMKFFKMNNYHDSYDKKWYLIDETNNIEHSVKECAKDICLFVDNIHKSNYLSTQKKYSKPEYEKVAQLILGK